MERKKKIILFISAFLHFVCEVFTCFYVFIFNSKYDLYYTLYIFIIIILKLLFKYECLWSIFDKKLINHNYIVGSNPKYYPFRKIMYGNENIIYIISILLFTNFFIIFFRNKNKIIKFLTLVNAILIVYVELKISKIK